MKTDPINYTFVFSQEYEKQKALSKPSPAQNTSSKRPGLDSDKFIDNDTTINLVEQHTSHLDTQKNTRPRELQPSSQPKPFTYGTHKFSNTGHLIIL